MKIVIRDTTTANANNKPTTSPMTLPVDNPFPESLSLVVVLNVGVGVTASKDGPGKSPGGRPRSLQRTDELYTPAIVTPVSFLMRSRKYSLVHRLSSTSEQNRTYELFDSEAHTAPRDEEAIILERKTIIEGTLSVPPSAKILPNMESDIDWKMIAEPSSGAIVDIEEMVLETILERPTKECPINRIGPILEREMEESNRSLLAISRNEKPKFPPSLSVVIDLMVIFLTL
mmetsp:Transcript_3356/g.6305  ORF Transcript_3356/g.6305 Transcript_3356/m.6305 type:complete len:230 (+) Transcript_3356:954-1643(+)|eukprot:CAMPEP_0184683618 /NCGR_PEP_ID=MMETSP0312-20130426/11977_1 /TAXON_ID=31354 /ORGANISM="Compsopogon coeruleus, Strain SAG 36.94" /LENGTH=229 /DNA_ID=CAMNT_0027136083 /DNA_START=933 /DNA_END=1625 /DNA_ORIENTATION=+